MNPEMKKKILTLAAVVLCLAILGTGTLAYYTDKAMAHNVITSGGVDIRLVEQMKNSQGSWVEFENQSGVMPGDKVSKKVTVKSDALSAPAWVRVQVVSSDSEAMRLDYNGSAYNTADWAEHGGFYYYKKVLPTGAETAPLFENVVFSTGMGNEYQSSSLTLRIVAEAVQSENNIPASGDPWDAGGWTVIQPLIRRMMN